MPVYNGAPFLKEAIGSILNQSYPDFELLIINDGSADDSHSIIQSFTDNRIKYIKQEVNRGIIATLNYGIKLAKGSLIARMDADDIAMPMRFEEQVNFLQKNPEYAAVFSKIELIDESGNSKGVWADDWNSTTEEQVKKTLNITNSLAHPTAMIRKNVLEKYGYNPSFKASEDWGLWHTLISDGYRIYKINKVLLKYRIHTESVTVKENSKNVQKKIIRFKAAYFAHRLRQFKFTKYDFALYRNLLKDLLKFVLPDFIFLPYRLFRKKPLRILVEWLNLTTALIKNRQAGVFFFFPFYQTGGAEKVHASIVETVAGKKPIVLMTGYSHSKALYKDFRKNAVVLDSYHLTKFGPAKRWLTNKLKKFIEQNKDVILFGCNSQFYYELIPMLPEKIRCIDLLHAFVHEYEDGPEKWSKNLVSRLSNRVVINKKTIDDFKNFYIRNNIPLAFLDRIICISNFTEPKNYTKKDEETNLKILYAGRGGEEKRVYLIAELAKLAHERELFLEFHFAGDLSNAIPDHLLHYCNLHGEISDPLILEKFYHDAHLLLITSSREGFPMVIMEAMMHSVVPVATNVGGISEHITNYKNGILIDQADESQIIEEFYQVLKHLSENRQVLTELSLNAHQYALKNFRKDVFVDSYRKLLSSR